MNVVYFTDRFLTKHEPPFIAEVDRTAPSELERSPGARGSIQLWYPAERKS